MHHSDLHTDSSTRPRLAGVHVGQLLTFSATSDGGVRREYGICCDADAIQIRGVDPWRVTASMLRQTMSIEVHVLYGHLMFDHTNGSPHRADWQPMPYGRRKPGEDKPYQAALVYGDATVSPEPQAVRLYWGTTGQDVDDFRATLLNSLTSGT